MRSLPHGISDTAWKALPKITLALVALQDLLFHDRGGIFTAASKGKTPCNSHLPYQYHALR
jgi:hypothetical protein